MTRISTANAQRRGNPAAGCGAATRANDQHTHDAPFRFRSPAAATAAKVASFRFFEFPVSPFKATCPRTGDCSTPVVPAVEVVAAGRPAADPPADAVVAAASAFEPASCGFPLGGGIGAGAPECALPPSSDAAAAAFLLRIAMAPRDSVTSADGGPDRAAGTGASGSFLFTTALGVDRRGVAPIARRLTNCRRSGRPVAQGHRHALLFSRLPTHRLLRFPHTAQRTSHCPPRGPTWREVAVRLVKDNVLKVPDLGEAVACAAIRERAVASS